MILRPAHPALSRPILISGMYLLCILFATTAQAIPTTPAIPFAVHDLMLVGVDYDTDAFRSARATDYVNGPWVVSDIPVPAVPGARSVDLQSLAASPNGDVWAAINATDDSGVFGDCTDEHSLGFGIYRYDVATDLWEAMVESWDSGVNIGDIALLSDHEVAATIHTYDWEWCILTGTGEGRGMIAVWDTNARAVDYAPTAAFYNAITAQVATSAAVISARQGRLTAILPGFAQAWMWRYDGASWTRGPRGFIPTEALEVWPMSADEDWMWGQFNNGADQIAHRVGNVVDFPALPGACGNPDKRVIGLVHPGGRPMVLISGVGYAFLENGDWTCRNVSRFPIIAGSTYVGYEGAAASTNEFVFKGYRNVWGESRLVYYRNGQLGEIAPPAALDDYYMVGKVFTAR